MRRLPSNEVSETLGTIQAVTSEAKAPAIFEPCIYCGSTEPRAGREHVVPQGLGMFAQNWTLLTEVCDSCNKYFGRELDLQISRDSIEAYLRIASGLKPARAADKLMHRRMKATLLADGLFDGVRVRMKPTDKGDDILPVPAAQVGFRRPGQDWVSLTEREWSREAIAAAGAGSNVEVRLVAESGELDRLRNKLAGFGCEISETDRALEQVPEGRATVQFDFAVDTTMRRAAAKIAFNYAARVLGGDVMRRSDFDAIREFVRNGIEPYPMVAAQDVSILVGPEAANTQTHAVGIAWAAEKRLLAGAVSLFNKVTYGVPALSQRFR